MSLPTSYNTFAPGEGPPRRRTPTYIAVFVAFSIPAIVMATDWCDNQTYNAKFKGTAGCDSVAPAFLDDDLCAAIDRHDDQIFRRNVCPSVGRTYLAFMRT